MSNLRYTEEFKAEAVKQITERGHPVAHISPGRRDRFCGTNISHATCSQRSY